MAKELLRGRITEKLNRKMANTGIKRHGNRIQDSEKHRTRNEQLENADLNTLGK